MASPTPQEKFKQVTLEFFDFVKATILNMHEDGLTDTSPGDLELPETVIRAYNKDKLIGHFVDCADDWPQIVKRDNHFILEVVPESYKAIPFDVKILSMPLAWYIEKTKNLTPEQIANLEETEDWAVISDDVNNMWEYFQSMARIAVNYVIQMRQSEPDFHSEIDIPYFVKAFGM